MTDKIDSKKFTEALEELSEMVGKNGSGGRGKELSQNDEDISNDDDRSI